MKQVYTAERLVQLAKARFDEEHATKRLDGWFLGQEIRMAHEADYADEPRQLAAAHLLRDVIAEAPLDISDYAVFAGTQDDAFARSYALINPSFRVESFSGYCDPTAVYDDIEPNGDITRERIEAARAHTKRSDYVRALADVYDRAGRYTQEAVFFVEQVTGHVIPDFRAALRSGVRPLIAEAEHRLAGAVTEKQRVGYASMRVALESVLLLAERYRSIALEKMAEADANRRAELSLMADALARVPAEGARNLFEAMQSFLLLWQVMCVEQSPNPYAFSVGNADRIFEPYRAMDGLDRETAAALFMNLLTFYNVADRSWAISQNVLVGGRDLEGNDLTNEMTYAILDAYFEMNLPQPILSVKLHRNTPKELYRSMGRFFFTPGCLTPSLFNDDALFETLSRAGIDREDLPDYSVAGCQEPLIMGRDNGNTTNSWLNLAKILELTVTNGVSELSGKEIGAFTQPADAETVLREIRPRFYQNVAGYLAEMEKAANGATEAVALLPVPFLSAFMGGMETGIDMRDTREQGTKYNASGCLIHGLSVVADAFEAADEVLRVRPEDSKRLLDALHTNFEDDEELRQFLLSCPKYGNNVASVDREAAELANRISDMVHGLKNPLGNRFRADWSSPSTHLLYGYQVGATMDGRKAREMLGYGVDPLYGEAENGLGFRILSSLNLPFEKFDGGYASHFGIDPRQFRAATMEERGEHFYGRVIAPLFFGDAGKCVAPSYLYVNVTTPETLRKVLDNPKKYAPSGVYIMRIHGTFVNFLDLSPAIQTDIIKRLDLQSTAV